MIGGTVASAYNSAAVETIRRPLDYDLCVSFVALDHIFYKTAMFYVRLMCYGL